MYDHDQGFLFTSPLGFPFPHSVALEKKERDLLLSVGNSFYNQITIKGAITSIAF